MTLHQDSNNPEYTFSHRFILGMRVDTSSLAEARKQIMACAEQASGQYICLANVHMCMESYDDTSFQQTVNHAALVVADGAPLVWALRSLGIKKASQVRGQDLSLHLLEDCARNHIPVGLFGASPAVLDQFCAVLRARLPALQLVYTYSPPFRTITPEEDARISQGINASGARILLVGLGCPKQERWMQAHAQQINAVMLGVGAAFDFLASTKPNAPLWMQKIGMEWLFRLSTEPQRLWKRYAKHNPRFIFFFFRQWLGSCRK